ncbi:MAG: iron-sulfur cluster assembly scaffold protein [Burkholderiales bacterium]
MYTPQVFEHFQHPRNAGELPDATARVEVTNPVCGDVMQLAARLENGVVAAVRFKTSGCVPAIAAGSLLTELMLGRRLDELAAITDQEVSEGLGGLPPASHHAAQLAADALCALLAELPP